MHGTFLLGFDLPVIDRYLRFPSRQPAYRRDRPHGMFLTNLPVDPAGLKSALRDSWRAHREASFAEEERLENLVAARYARREWNFRM
jgi:lipoate-protein ligase A